MSAGRPLPGSAGPLCRDWPYDEPAGKPARPFGLRAGQPKGHKWQVEKAERVEKVAKNMQDMPNKIAAYRVRGPCLSRCACSWLFECVGDASKQWKDLPTGA